MIKFRGKNEKGWHYGPLVIENNVCRIITTDGFQVKGPYIQGELYVYGVQTVDCDSVGQFILLHDMSGEEIYTGDILQHVDYTFGEIVYYNKSKGRYFGRAVAFDSLIVNEEINEERVKKMSIVGNVYDNKDVLGNRYDEILKLVKGGICDV